MKGWSLFVLVVATALAGGSLTFFIMRRNVQEGAAYNPWPLLILAVCLAGAAGGTINALISDNGFFLPSKEDVGGKVIWRPGFLANILIGAVAAFISWGMYGPLSATLIIPLHARSVEQPTPQSSTQESRDASKGTASGNAMSDDAGLTLAGLVGAILVGVAGARWLSNEVDKVLLRAAATTAAAKTANAAASQAILMGTPVDAARAAANMP